MRLYALTVSKSGKSHTPDHALPVLWDGMSSCSKLTAVRMSMQDLIDFLKKGSPPIYFGFGSMVRLDPI